MKLAEIIPLYKKGERYYIENYRPISLLITVSKLLEKCMYSRIYRFLDKHNILYEKQWISIQTLLWTGNTGSVWAHIKKQRERTKNNGSLPRFIKGLWHPLTWFTDKKLEVYGLRGQCQQWLESYISNRTLQVKCKTLSCNVEETSNQYQITYGTPQDSCLGPLLFNIFCNDIHLNIDYCKLILFADDTTLYTNHRNSTFLTFEIQHDLENVDKWFRANYLSLTISKTFSMEFLPEGNKLLNHLVLNSIKLPLVKNTKFLGVTIDNNLSWNAHINNVIKKYINKKI